MGAYEFSNAWTRLAEQGGVPTPFQSLAWAELWLHHRQREVQPCVLLLPGERTLAPFGVQRVAGASVLRFLGTGDSDYVGLVTVDALAQAWDATAQQLAARRRDWDLLHLHSVADPEPIVAALREYLGVEAIARPYEPCPGLETDDWDELIAARPKKLRRELRRWRRRLEERGPVAIRAEKTPLDADLIAQLIDVERSSWKWEAGTAGLGPGPRRAFLEAALGEARLSARVWLLHVGEQLVAFALVLEGDDVWYYYHPSFRSEFPAAGSLLLGEVVRAACEGNCRYLDLLRGPQPYKLLWADQTRMVHEIVCPMSVRGQLLAWAFQLRWRAAQSPVIRRARERLVDLGKRLRPAAKDLPGPPGTGR